MSKVTLDLKVPEEEREEIGKILRSLIVSIAREPNDQCELEVIKLERLDYLGLDQYDVVPKQKGLGEYQFNPDLNHICHFFGRHAATMEVNNNLFYFNLSV